MSIGEWLLTPGIVYVTSRDADAAETEGKTTWHRNATARARQAPTGDANGVATTKPVELGAAITLAAGELDEDTAENRTPGCFVFRGHL